MPSVMRTRFWLACGLGVVALAAGVHGSTPRLRIEASSVRNPAQVRPSRALSLRETPVGVAGAGSHGTHVPRRTTVTTILRVAMAPERGDQP